MSKQASHTDIQLLAPPKDILKTLAAQYRHMEPGEARAFLEKTYPQVWCREELLQQFQILAEAAPIAYVEHKASGQRGTVTFVESPRFYFNFQPKDSDGT